MDIQISVCLAKWFGALDSSDSPPVPPVSPCIESELAGYCRGTRDGIDRWLPNGWAAEWFEDGCRRRRGWSDSSSPRVQAEFGTVIVAAFRAEHLNPQARIPVICLAGLGKIHRLTLRVGRVRDGWLSGAWAIGASAGEGFPSHGSRFWRSQGLGRPTKRLADIVVPSDVGTD